MRLGQGLPWALFLLALLTPSCQRAERYGRRPDPKATKADDLKPPPPLPEVAWLEPKRVPWDLPIQFVPSGSKEWENLPAFWNVPPVTGQRTAPLGLPAVNAVAALVLTDRRDAIKIKVPLGLPDPTPHIPASNPPTFRRWKLGKELFFARMIRVKENTEKLACATCHQPDREGKGYTEEWPRTPHGNRNTPSLINGVYNKHQFWDGRVTWLEQVLVRDINDETPDPAKEDARLRHAWPGIIKALETDEELRPIRDSFDAAFGVLGPTQDTVAKALATYLRTVLSGNSIYDRAESERVRLGDKELSVRHFQGALYDAELKTLGFKKRDEAGRELAAGHQVFIGKARCVHCHPPPLFSDQDFHNIGLSRFSDEGRFEHMPIGLKERRLKGAFKTPTLRALPRTKPYMHDGSRSTLQDVVAYYNAEIDAQFYDYVDRELLEARFTARRLNLTADEIRALVLFLQALDGDPIDAIIANPPAKR